MIRDPVFEKEEIQYENVLQLIKEEVLGQIQAGQLYDNNNNITVSKPLSRLSAPTTCTASRRQS